MWINKRNIPVTGHNPSFNVKGGSRLGSWLAAFYVSLKSIKTMGKILSFEQEFTRRYENRPQILRFMREAIGVSEVNYSDCTLTNLENVRNLMLSRLAQNSVHVYCAIIKSFLNTVSEEVELPTLRFAKALRVKTVPSQHCCLTEEELIRFDEYRPRNQNEMDAKILFMRGAFSGARNSDCRVMSLDNIHDNTLSYVSIKTKVAVDQPIHSRIVKYLQMQPSRDRDQSDVNRTIRVICKRLGFNEPVTLSRNGKMVTKQKWQWASSHMARRSFATSLAVRGVPVEIIAKLCGHEQSTTTSKHYICIDTKKLGSEALGFFND